MGTKTEFHDGRFKAEPEGAAPEDRVGVDCFRKALEAISTYEQAEGNAKEKV